MARVSISSDGRGFTGGMGELELAATDVRGLIHALDARFPGLGDYVQRRMAIAIDGEIHQDAWAEPLRPDAEVFLIPRIGGG
ncbi:MoaD/ThiS family protein [Phenylobacterium montanum]|uniref:MoaD/ThiS family protein n=1 Tax=Phenylobacterium montanum TaxID=2823693 RepID=A0A975ISV9_9CAUL|nr:MoaD/ThiS family protein [Caulobacter sp. S6]QUD86222.1 MoaD/ThiS family protein [Caulobacter sp. S6]